MEQLKNKKVSFLIILFSILMLIFGMITKDYNGDYYKHIHNEPTLKFFDVNFFGLSFGYVNFMFLFTMFLGIGVYLFFYKDDQSIKRIIKRPKLRKRIKTKHFEVESTSLPKEEFNEIELTKKNRTLTIVRVLTVFALTFTLYMATNMGFSLWFFIIFAYFHLISLTSKSKKEILIKSMVYPLVFLMIIILPKQSVMIYGMEIEQPFSYKLSNHLLPFIIGVVLMYISQRRRFGNPPRFSLKSPLFWVSLLCLIISVIRYGFDKYIEASLY